MCCSGGKGPQRVYALQERRGGLSLILHTKINLTLKTNAHACMHLHTNTRMKVHCREEQKVKGHFKWRCTGPDFALGMTAGKEMREGWEEIAKLKAHARLSVFLHLTYNGGKRQE